MAYDNAVTKLWIGSLDDLDLTVNAQYNPKELQIDSPIAWAEHDVLGAKRVATKPMEFTGMGSETMKVELFFDYFESGDFKALHDKITTIKKLASVIDPNEMTNGDRQRPHYCVVAWGGLASKFQCVIESVSVKYTMFTPSGRPVRATVIVGLKSGRRPNDKERSALKAQQRKAPKQPAG